MCWDELYASVYRRKYRIKSQTLAVPSQSDAEEYFPSSSNYKPANAPQQQQQQQHQTQLVGGGVGSSASSSSATFSSYPQPHPDQGKGCGFDTPQGLYNIYSITFFKKIHDIKIVMEINKAADTYECNIHLF